LLRYESVYRFVLFIDSHILTGTKKRGGVEMDGRLTITEIAKALGITPRTIMRWEKAGKVKKPKRDWRGWRFYHREDLEDIKQFYETTYEQEDFSASAINTVKDVLVVILAVAALLASSIIICAPIYAEAVDSSQTKGITETAKTVDVVLDELPVVDAAASSVADVTEAVKYTLGPNDVVSIEVRRHPEFSGKYAVNSEGKIGYKYIGDIIVSGLTKIELKQRLSAILSEYIIEPDVDVQIVAYLSKVFYVVGEVHRPGKFFMRGDTINVREALVQSGLPTYSAAMRRSRLITPDESGKKRAGNNYVSVNVYSLLYEGDLEENLVMQPNDILYVPATAVAKMLRVISPATSAAGQATSAVTTGAALGGL